ncbi:MAG: ATP-dependent 6-phosphofructokinase [Lentisphaerae bacterium]|nr:ATP-dependent 6-phosphofructokinase [Lentisphaerota bacterium]
MPPKLDTTISSLGTCRHPSPLALNTIRGDGIRNFISDQTRIRYEVEIPPDAPPDNETFFERAGPREHLFYDPARIRAAIVTCGGLCPGINNVIRSVFLEFYHNYRVRDILGIRHGFRGLTARGEPPLKLSPDLVEDIHRDGGSILSSSRGKQDTAEMVHFLLAQGINILVCIGGDGTQKGTHAIAQEITRRRLPISVVGVPKTIDNDIQFVSTTFGYFSAIESARDILDGAHCESKGAPNGIGLVKLMGRDSGFIAAGAAAASQEVNFVLVPEIPVRLDGPKGFLATLHQRMTARHHAVVVVAEGAGQELMTAIDTTDASGNRLKADIGVFLRDRIQAFFREQGTEVSLKYIDPSYIIRSIPANSQDARLCDAFGRHAVHAAMAGKTDLIVGFWHGMFIHVPIPAATASRKKIDPEGELWHAVMSSTGQPALWE